MSEEHKLNIVNGIFLCDGCLNGDIGQCNTPGCALWKANQFDKTIRKTILATGGSITLQSIDMQLKILRGALRQIADIDIIKQSRKFNDALEQIASFEACELTASDAKYMIAIARKALEGE